MKKVAFITALAILLAVHAFSQSFQWARQVTGSESDYIYDMTTDASGNIYAVGAFAGTITLGGITYTAADSDILLAKYNSSGGFIWGKVITDTGTSTAKDVGRSIALDANNNVYICGDYNYQKNFNPGGTGGTTPNNPNMHFIAKYTSSGGFQWVKTIQTGGSFFNAIAFSPAQNRIYIGGRFFNSGNNVDFDPDPLGFLYLNDVNGQPFIASYTLDGVVAGAESFGASSDIKDLAIDPAGNVYVTGYLAGSSINLNPNGPGTSFDPADGRMLVAKYSANIDYISASQITGGGTNDEGLSIIAPANDQIFYGGRVNGGLYLARLNSSFSLVYEKRYGGSGAVTAITTDGSSLYFSASSSSNTSIDLGNGVTLNPVNPGGDILLAKTNLTGLANWGATIPISNARFAVPPTSTSIKAVDNNEFILAGYFNGSTDFNTCANSTSLTANSTDGFMVRYSGEYWSKGIGPISGPNNVCISNNTSFTIDNLPKGYTVTWSASPTSLFGHDSETGNSFTTYASNSSSYGQGTITAIISGDCGSTPPITKEVLVGVPLIEANTIKISNGIEEQGYWCTNVFGNSFSFYYAYSYNSFDVKLTNLDETHLLSEFSIMSTEGTINEFPSAGQYVLWIRAVNECGPANSWTKLVVEYKKCGSGGGLGSLSVSPNPSSAETTISIVDEENTTNGDLEPWEIKIYDKNQRLIFEKKNIKSKRITVNTRLLKDGIYSVQAYYKGEVIMHKLMVSK
ncbi:SBBP repeat-containing protein [Nafulsella turpanensis]|uniref:SBBP repeat-containing protein n=1 Tax=Nafulsella turpanensis TaxID=1265690 RepID=UPI00035E59CE|nr:SBBP repeat-containing protein [Nafulsella turpanensis]